MQTLVVLPTYNEAANLGTIVPRIIEQGDFGVLIVDDNSPDGTGELADRLREIYPDRVDVLHRAQKLGQGRAYIAGFARALATSADYIVTMDADFSHDPADLPRLVDALRDHDVAIGSRRVPGGAAINWPLTRQIVSRGGSLYAQLMLGLPIHDLTTGYKGFRRSVLDLLDLETIASSGFSFHIEMNWRCVRQGLRVKEIPILFVDRRVGRSKMSKRIFIEAMLLVAKLRWQNMPWSSADPVRRSPLGRL
jgi:dolichol-phosphate mannosyltransferase